MISSDATTTLSPPRPDAETSGRVLVWFEATSRGRAALDRAAHLAAATDAELTVVTVATPAPLSGCASCRHSAVIWNRELREIAQEELVEAATRLGPLTTARFVAEEGELADSIARAARACGATTIVLPQARAGRILSGPDRRLDARLRERGAWRIVF